MRTLMILIKVRRCADCTLIRFRRCAACSLHTYKYTQVCVHETWHTHISYIKEKAWNRINIMRKLKFQLDRKSLEIIYTSFIRPILEYGNGTTVHSMKKKTSKKSRKKQPGLPQELLN